jgi:hypothetical protein
VIGRKENWHHLPPVVLLEQPSPVWYMEQRAVFVVWDGKIETAGYHFAATKTWNGSVQILSFSLFPQRDKDRLQASFSFGWSNN